MNNYGIQKFENVDVDTFTSDIGMDIRKKTDKIMSLILKQATKSKLIKYNMGFQKECDNKIELLDKLKLLKNSGIEVMNYPTLENDKPYIFASLHNFVDDSMANLATIDRNAYLLFGTSDQLKVNNDMYAAWANGFIYVDRNDTESRSDSISKMVRLVKNGNSVLIFPEGGLNNTENLFCQKLFGGPYYVSKLTGVQIVPVAPLYEYGSNKIYMNFGEPISILSSKKETLCYLRDILSSLLYENLLANSKLVYRNELGNDPRMDFMIQRCKEYQKTNWTKDVFDEELTRYFDKDDVELNDVYNSINNIELTEQNANIIVPYLLRNKENDNYDFKKYMHKNWNKR